MNRKTGIAFALCLFAAGSVGADDRDHVDDDHDGNVRNCIASEIRECSEDCKTSRCVQKCEKEARAKCKVNVIQTQHVFNGAVTSTPLPQCPDASQQFLSCQPGTSDNATGCSQLSGTVANRAYWGGSVTVYVICPAGSPVGHPSEVTTTTTIGRGTSSCSDGSFSFVATNACGGQRTGCYGLIAATPPTSCEACGTCRTDVAPGDPGWNTCTSDACPSP